MPRRSPSLAAELARAGFLETGRAERVLGDRVLRGLADVPTALEAFGTAADPDLALLTLERIVNTGSSETAALMANFVGDAGFRDRLVLVLGASAALGEHLVRHPLHWRALTEVGGALRRPTRAHVVDELRAAVSGLGEGPATLALRVAYRRLLLGLIARDLSGEATFNEVTAELADLADGVLAAGLDVARAAAGQGSTACRLSVIAMGKCGGRELNYASDVDVVFVADSAHADGDRAGEAPALAVATELARGLMRVANATTAEGSIWEVDAGLRPEGKSGALVRTLASHVGYYQRWAQTWEYQALLKARFAAGDAELGAEYLAATADFVWSAADRAGFVSDVQDMRRRVEHHVPAGQANWQLKLGRGGLRDVEFSVQLLQLVHGRSDPAIRSPNTIAALNELAAWGYVGREDASVLADAYEFLRRLEHRVQMYRLQRSAVVPHDPVSLRRLGRAMGLDGDPAEQLLTRWREHARAVRRLHEKLFYRPLLDAVASLKSSEARLSWAAAVERLTALGYADPTGALRHVQALTSGVSRRAVIQRTLLPVMLGWFADGPDPDAGLLGFRRVSEALGATPWYLRLLRDESAVARRMAGVLSTSRFVSDLLVMVPEFVASLGDDEALRPRTTEAVHREMAAAVNRATQPMRAIALVRSVRRRELLRLAVAELESVADVAGIGRGISGVTDAAIDSALEIACGEVRGDSSELRVSIAVIAMGRLGGAEMSYSSDADVMFVFEPTGDDSEAANRDAVAIANRVIDLLGSPGPELTLIVDASLRPEGRIGSLVRSLGAYEAYYRRWSAPWEAQALLRARWCAGDRELGDRFLSIVDRCRYPEAGVSPEELREIRRLKARMESERLPRGADPALHLKLGRGGLSDVEWVAQLWQLRFAHAHEALRTTNTMEALSACLTEGLIDEDDVGTLSDAWQMAARVRNAITLVTGRSSNQIPSDTRTLAGVSHALGYPQDDRGRLTEDYLRCGRRARSVVERLFYGWR